MNNDSPQAAVAALDKILADLQFETLKAMLNA